MIEKQHRALIPQYMEGFSCIGPACEDTCCAGWTIVLDQKTYKKYKKCQHPDTKDLFDKALVRNKKNPTPHSYGKIKLSEKDGSCPFLSEGKLCKIYSALGEDHLSDVCYFYPRHINKINGVLEISASISCPEVARLALLDSRPMEFLETNAANIRPYFVSYSIDNTESFDYQNDYLFYFWDLRIFTISVLQDRRYSLDERFLLLGLVMKKVAKLKENRRLSELSVILERYQVQFDQTEDIKKMIQDASDVSVKGAFSHKLVAQFSDPNILANFSIPSYLDSVEKIINGLDILSSSMECIEKTYKDTYEHIYQPFFNEKGYILENYFVNEVFKELYPLARFDAVDVSYERLFTQYNMIKFHLIGVASYYKELNDEIVISVLQSFSRAILHHREYLNLFCTNE